MLSVIEQKRRQRSKTTEAQKKSQLGQFLTPETTAIFMANLFQNGEGKCRLLDAGAGIGSLSAAFLDRWQEGGLQFQQVTLDAVEIDSVLISDLAQTLEKYNKNNFAVNIHQTDFIHAAVDSLSGSLFTKSLATYTHVILNPPYKKINRNSAHRQALSRVGIETVNLYSAFVALAIALTEANGQIVAIIPRSFCNGLYYRPFRKFMLEHAVIRHIHLFESRNQAFKDDGVLQENIIIHLQRGVQQGSVTISTSTDDLFSDLLKHEYNFDRIVLPDDSEQIIHIPSSPEHNALELPNNVCHTLKDLGLKVSTGPVVDFRLRAHLRQMPTPETIPLLYPIHFSGDKTTWPIEGCKKPNAIAHNSDTQKWLYPTGFYCVVRRFSSKEEKRRIVASVVDPKFFGDASVLGFENHLNLFHDNKQALAEPLAWGLATFLNTSLVDTYFRRFSGHTQVNATDLKLMKYPSRKILLELGEWAMQQDDLTQTQIDAKLAMLTT